MVQSWVNLIAAVILGAVLLATGCRPPSWWVQIKRSRKTLDTNPTEPRRKNIYEIPGPRTLPFIGSTWIFSWFGRYSLNKVHEAYKDMKNLYGNLCKEESYGNYPVVSVFSRQDIEAILKKYTKYPLRPPQEVISYYRRTRVDRYANVGLVNEQGVTWQKLRSSLTPELMRAKTVLGFLPALNGVTDDFVSLIRSRRINNTVVGFEELSYKIALESTCMLMLGRQLGFIRPENNSTLTRRLAEAVRVHFLASRDAFYGFPTWKFLNTRAYRRLVRSEDDIYNIISEFINVTLRQQQNDAQDNEIEAVFRSILRGKNLNMEDKQAGIVDFISAGIHTVGNTLVFLLYHLAKNPEVQRRLQKEADFLVPPRCDINVEDLASAEYMRAFITEVFRLLPTAPCIARILPEAVQFGDYDLPSGTVVLLHTWLAGLEEANFKDASKCRPERWLKGSQITPHSPDIITPFGFGKRICPGKRFVEYALQLILAKIVREYDIRAEEELDLQFEFILAPKGPVKLSFYDRVDAT